MALLIIEIVLNIYGIYQNTIDIFSMVNKTFTKSATYKFLILCSISSIFNYSVNFVIMAWQLIDTNDESCYYFGIGFIFTDFSNVWSIFGISAFRFISVVKKKSLIKLGQLEDVLWKFMFPIFLALALTLMFTIFESGGNVLKQVSKYLTYNYYILLGL